MPLLPARRAAVLLAAALAAAVVAFGLLVHGQRSAGWLDRRAEHAVGQLPGWVFRVVVLPNEPAVAIAVLIGAVLLAGARRARVAAVAVLATGVATTVNAVVLKPGFDRRCGDTLAYPSGHMVLMGCAFGVLTLATRRRAVAAASVLVWAGAAVSMVGLRYHYLTDALGGLCWAIAVIVGVAALVDLVAGRTTRTRDTDPRCGAPNSGAYGT